MATHTKNTIPRPFEPSSVNIIKKYQSIIAFINPGSGGQYGNKLYTKLQCILGLDHVFNLDHCRPKDGNKKNLRILACGGDGTVGWILSEMDSIKFKFTPSVSPIPLGTGNDMSRVLQWGANYTGEPLLNWIDDITYAIPIRFDRWNIYSHELNVEQIASLFQELRHKKLTTSNVIELEDVKHEMILPLIIEEEDSEESDMEQTPCLQPHDSIINLNLDQIPTIEDQLFSFSKLASKPSLKPRSSTIGSATTTEHRDLVRPDCVTSDSELLDIQESRIKLLDPDEDLSVTNSSRAVVQLRKSDDSAILKKRSSNSMNNLEYINHSSKDGNKTQQSKAPPIARCRSRIRGVNIDIDDPQPVRRSHHRNRQNGIGTRKWEGRPQLPKRVAAVSVSDSSDGTPSSTTGPLNNVNSMPEDANSAKHIKSKRHRSCPLNDLPETDNGNLDTGIATEAISDGWDNCLGQDGLQQKLPSPSTPGRTSIAPTTNEKRQIPIVSAYVSPPPEAKTLVMNNYFSFGVDSLIALDFHRARKASPHLFPHQIINKAWYGIFGIKSAFTQSLSKPLHKNLRLELDGKPVQLPKQLQAIVFLQIPSYSSGTQLWGEYTNLRNQKSPPSVFDSKFEVVGLRGVLHLSTLQTGLSTGIRIGQAYSATITNLVTIPVQCDGEPWLLPPCVTHLTHRNQSLLLFNSRREKTCKRYLQLTGDELDPSTYSILQGNLVRATGEASAMLNHADAKVEIASTNISESSSNQLPPLAEAEMAIKLRESESDNTVTRKSGSSDRRRKHFEGMSKSQSRLPEHKIEDLPESSGGSNQTALDNKHHSTHHSRRSSTTKSRPSKGASSKRASKKEIYLSTPNLPSLKIDVKPSPRLPSDSSTSSKHRSETVYKHRNRSISSSNHLVEDAEVEDRPSVLGNVI